MYTLDPDTAPLFIRGCLTNSLAKGRCSKSLTRTSWTKSARRGQSVRSREGGGLRGIWNSALIGCSSESGGSPWASSMAVIPKDQTSHRASYHESNCCSHAITCNKITWNGLVNYRQLEKGWECLKTDINRFEKLKTPLFCYRYIVYLTEIGSIKFFLKCLFNVLSFFEATP